MWNPFKKKLKGEDLAQRITEWATTKHEPKKAIYNIFPRLTKTELIALESCINFATKGCKIIRIEPNLRKAVSMKSLTDKGYLVRVKKGHYQLSFYGTKRT